jgi:hypothetical protein
MITPRNLEKILILENLRQIVDLLGCGTCGVRQVTRVDRISRVLGPCYDAQVVSYGRALLAAFVAFGLQSGILGSSRRRSPV